MIRVVLTDKGITLTSAKGTRSYNYGDYVFTQPLEFFHMHTQTYQMQKWSRYLRLLIRISPNLEIKRDITTIYKKGTNENK